MFGNILAGLASLFANPSGSACDYWWFDEVECPKSLIK